MSARPGRLAYERREAAVPARASNLSAGLVARSRELAHVDQMLWQARRGASGVVALRGESGVGKSSLVEAVVARATEFRMVQVRGRLEPERASLPPQWPGPLGELADSVGQGAGAAAPVPSFASGAGHSGGPGAPSPELVDAAAGTLRRMATSSGSPLLVTIDDCQVLPPALVVAIAVAVVTQLSAEAISLVLAWRDTPHLEPFELDGADVPVHRLGGLTLPQARQLLASRFDQLPSEGVLGELVGRTGGNPLALVDVCGRLTPAQLGGWHPIPDPLPMGEALVDAFDVVRYLPAPTRRALAVVAAGGARRDAMSAAMARLGVDSADLVPAMEAGVIYERGPRMDFRHPLVRSAAFHREPPDVRYAVRSALSDALEELQAIEASAYQAAIDVAEPDELASRRLAEAARVALDRGDPAAAARHEELAAMCAPAADAVGQHLADACGHWIAAGELERAQQCAGSGAGAMSAPVAAELAYQRARLVLDHDERTAADRMVDAAEACMAERPHRALAMLVDAAAWRILADQPGGAEDVAERAVSVAAAVSSHSEVLARAVRGAAALACGDAVDEVALRSNVSLLIGQTERFPSSPEVALVIGRSLALQGLRHQAHRWAQWIDRCAEHSGDVGLGVVPPLLSGSLLLADGHVEEATAAIVHGASAAGRAGRAPLAAWASHLAVHVHAVAGAYELGLSGAAALFARTDRSGGLARLRVLPALALLELQRGRPRAAVAWIRTLEHDLDVASPARRTGALDAELAAPIAALLLLARSREELVEWASATDRSVPLEDPLGQGKDAWLRGMLDPDPEEAVGLLEAAGASWRDLPLRRVLIDLCRAVRLEECGRTADAVAVLESAERDAGDAGAGGLAVLAARERGRLPVQAADALRDAPALAATPADAPGPSLGRVPPTDWDVTLLGGFAIRHRGKPVALPASLATQAVKIVALQPRITVDELIEHLWEDAEPGVGSRRLRNVLWRIRSACGDLLVREGSFLRLAAGAVTDVSRFRELADQALVGGDAGTARAVDLARVALDIYRGELLPGDRYADWAATARESIARTHLRLLDLLVDDAVAGARQAEALVLLDRLAEVDPFDERHHVRTAEIHLQAGNRGRARDALERAERMLADLNVAPSAAVRELRESLDRP